VLLALGALLLAPPLAGAGVYWGSPYYAVWRIERSARAGDSAAVAGFTDFAAVSANLPPAVAKAMGETPQAEPPRRRSFFERLKGLFAHVGRRTSPPADLTPDRLAALIATSSPLPGPPARSQGPARPEGPYVVKEGYVRGDLDDFHALLGNREHPSRGVALTLLRRGFLTWKITAIDLPSLTARGNGPEPGPTP
jgi:hypothetical protein